MFLAARDFPPFPQTDRFTRCSLVILSAHPSDHPSVFEGCFGAERLVAKPEVGP